MTGARFLERTLQGFTLALSRALVSEAVARRRGLLQRLDPRTRLIGVLLLVLVVTLSRSLAVVAAIFVLATTLALLSAISLASLARRVWLVVFAFTGLIAVPALFITPGQPLAAHPTWPVTQQGLRTAALLILRVETAVTLTTSLVLTTHWAQLLKALRSLRLPGEVVAMLAMTHRYIFLLIETANQMFESRRSRIVGRLRGAGQRGLAAGTAGVLLGKSMEMGNDVYLAMQSRGFRGEVRTLDEFRFRGADYTAFAMFLCVAIAAVWAGR